jgi:multiple sugar transport system permease protein
MSEAYDDIGGNAQAEALKNTFGGGAVDPFITGQVAMKIDGSPSLDWIAFYRPEMDFVCAPPPMPQDQIDAGKGPISWSGGFALVIPATSQQKEGAFKFIQYMYSWEAIQLMEQGKREQKQSEGKMYLPKGLANRVIFERLVQKYITENPDVPPRFRQAYEVVKWLMPKTRIRPVTPVGQLLWNQHVRATDLAINHAFAEQARKTGGDEIEMALASAVARSRPPSSYAETINGPTTTLIVCRSVLAQTQRATSAALTSRSRRR